MAEAVQVVDQGLADQRRGRVLGSPMDRAIAAGPAVPDIGQQAAQAFERVGLEQCQIGIHGWFFRGLDLLGDGISTSSMTDLQSLSKVKPVPLVKLSTGFLVERRDDCRCS